MRFVKGHGTGNDFVVLPDPDGDLSLNSDLVRALCDRRTGIGADGVLRVVLAAALPAEVTRRTSGAAGTAAGPAGSDAASVRWFMDYRNADGSIAEMCGNGIRVFARYLVDAGYEPPGPLVIGTRAGPRLVEVPARGEVTVDMGPPEFSVAGPVPVTLAGREFGASAVWMGNPHAVCFADDLDPAGLARLELGVPTVPDSVFPDGVNVEVVVARPGGVAMRVVERGVGETASCGTGACAAAVAWAIRRASRPPVEVPAEVLPVEVPPVEVDVDLPGGRLTVDWRGSTVLLRGPAVLVADGILRDAWLRETTAGAARGAVSSPVSAAASRPDSASESTAEAAVSSG